MSQIIRLPEVPTRVSYDTTVPLGLFSTPKDKFIESRLYLISKLRKEIDQMEQSMLVMDPESFEYKRQEKAIAKRRSIIKDCEQIIFVTREQMKVQTNARFRGL